MCFECLRVASGPAVCTYFVLYCWHFSRTRDAHDDDLYGGSADHALLGGERRWRAYCFELLVLWGGVYAFGAEALELVK